MNSRNYNTRNFSPRSARPRRRKRVTGRFILFLFIIVLIIAIAVVLALTFAKQGDQPAPGTTATTGASPAATTSSGEPKTSESAEPSSPKETLSADLAPAPVAGTKPSALGLKTGIMAMGKQVNSYERTDKINFPDASEYTKLEGVTTFRGNNYRTGGSYGTAEVNEKKLEIVWQKDDGAIDGWSGSCWTGQPLIVKWPEATKKVMNIISSEKSKADLKEVIYPTADGHIYFLDLDNGNKTRDPIDTGIVTKGTATIDPRGYPMMYTGQGINLVNGKSVPVKFRIYSLIDQKLLWSFGGKDPFSLRQWQAYDSSALVDPSSDTLVEGGENGLLYTAKLNTKYDEKAGTLSIDPEGLVKYRYTRAGYGEANTQRWWGIENSVVGFRNYAFFTDNGGTLQCVDLNTMKTVYATDVTDDSDTTMPLEVDAKNNTFYLYTANEVDKQKGQSNRTGKSYHRKINGLTGEVMWEHVYDAYNSSTDNGGTLTSPVLGQGNISNLIIYSMAMVPVKVKDSSGADKTVSGGRIVAYDRTTGKEAWRVETKADYWSSPLAIYDKDGNGYIVQCDRSGYMKLYNGLTGELLDTLNLSANDSNHSIEATPSAFGNMMVVGTRSRKIFGIKIK